MFDCQEVLERYEPHVQRLAKRIRPQATAIDVRANDRADYVSLLRTKALHAYQKFDDNRIGANEHGWVWTSMRNLATSAARKPPVQFVPLDMVDPAWASDEGESERRIEAREIIEKLRQRIPAQDMRILEAWTACGTPRDTWRLVGEPGNPRKFPERIREVLEKAKKVLEGMSIFGPVTSAQALLPTGEPNHEGTATEGSGPTRHPVHQRDDRGGVEVDDCREGQRAGNSGTPGCEPGDSRVLRADVGGDYRREVRDVRGAEALPRATGREDDSAVGCGARAGDDASRDPGCARSGDRIGAGGSGLAGQEDPEVVPTAGSRTARASTPGSASAGAGGSARTGERSEGRQEGRESEGEGGAEVQKEERQAVARGSRPGHGGGAGPSVGRVCVACGGSGLSSRGRVCHPCRGTGANAAAERKDWPAWQGEGGAQESQAEERQLDLLDRSGKSPAQESRQEGSAQACSQGGSAGPQVSAPPGGAGAVGGAHVPEAVGAGAPAVTGDRVGEAGQQDRPRIQRRPVRSPVPGGVLPDGGREVPDALQRGAADHGRQAVPGDRPGGPEGPRQDPAHGQLVGAPVLPARDVEEKGWISNLTNHQIEGPVVWKGHDPVMTTPEGYRVLQLVYWSEARAAWVWLVKQPTGRQPPPGVVELTIDQLLGLEGSRLQQGWTYNATTGQLSGPVDWGQWPAICTTRHGDRVYEVTFWSKELSCWVIVVAKRTGRQCPAGTIEIETDDVFRLQREIAAGADVKTAVQKVLAGGVAA